MALSDFVTVSISLTKAPVSRQGFGTPLILAADCPAAFTNRVRTYNTPADLLTAGFPAAGPTYLLASKLMTGAVAPSKFKVGRQALKPTQQYTLTPTVVDNTEYAGTFNGARWTFTSGGSTTATLITTGVKAAIQALATAQSRSIVVAGTTATTLTQTGAGGTFDSVSVETPSLMSLAVTHADPGVATDLTAIVNEDADFYAVFNPFGGKLTDVALATAVETYAGLKCFVANTCDSSHEEVVVGSASDLATTLQTAARYYTTVWYSRDGGHFLGAQVAGLALPQDAGSENWAMQTPAGPAMGYSATERANLVAKNCNFCESLGGQNNTAYGKVASGEWMDVVRFRSWLQVNIQADVITAVKAQAPKKLPYTDAGVALIQAAIQGVLNRGVDAGGLTNSPKPTVTVPLVANTSVQDRATRVLTGVTWTAQLSGAINAVMPITGQLTS